jgi:hypothetical protein
MVLRANKEAGDAPERFLCESGIVGCCGIDRSGKFLSIMSLAGERGRESRIALFHPPEFRPSFHKIHKPHKKLLTAFPRWAHLVDADCVL